jgi:hypothetical protein
LGRSQAASPRAARGPREGRRHRRARQCRNARSASTSSNPFRQRPTHFDQSDCVETISTPSERRNGLDHVGPQKSCAATTNSHERKHSAVADEHASNGQPTDQPTTTGAEGTGACCPKARRTCKHASEWGIVANWARLEGADVRVHNWGRIASTYMRRGLNFGPARRCGALPVAAAAGT